MKQNLRKIENFRKQNTTFDSLLRQELNCWNRYQETRKVAKNEFKKEELEMNWLISSYKIDGVAEVKGWSIDDMSEYINEIFPTIYGLKRL